MSLNELDLRIDVFRGGWPPGSAAIKITHLPTGLVEIEGGTCEPDIFALKATALERLTARVLEEERS